MVLSQTRRQHLRLSRTMSHHLCRCTYVSDYDCTVPGAGRSHAFSATYAAVHLDPDRERVRGSESGRCSKIPNRCQKARLERGPSTLLEIPPRLSAGGCCLSRHPPWGCEMLARPSPSMVDRPHWGG